MDRSEILAFITQAETEDIDPVGVAKAYAAMVDELQKRISEQDMQRLLLVGAAMFRNSVKGTSAELQLPPEPPKESLQHMLEKDEFKGLLH